MRTMTSNVASLIPDTHLFKQVYKEYISKGYSVIPDKFMSKMPAISDWSRFGHEMPASSDLDNWCRNFSATNVALLFGPSSGVIGLDLDTDDKALLDIILPLLPSSPVEKVGSKGFTRFFRYTNESTQMVKHNGECILEILSVGKKTTLPPSIHPNGSNYVWSSDKTLLDIDKSELPLLPPFLIANIESKLRLHFGDFESDNKGKSVSGRNNNLSQQCGTYISQGLPIDQAVANLVQYDIDTNEVPLFSDPSEMRHTEPFTNALAFYSNHLSTVNTKHFRKSEEYEVPLTGKHLSATDQTTTQRKKQKKLKRELPVAQGVLLSIQSNILSNSFIPQPAFAFSASLVLMSTLASRKFVFQGQSPNLYILNIAASGSGKDACQQKLKEILMDLKADNLLGAGDYVSDASLMDSLSFKPVRLDIMDEAGGILRTVNTGKAEYNGKMADVLAELYTSSNSKYLGRATAEGTKGSCYRPNVNILASTTPTGFQEGVSIRSIEKGLMGRFLIFQGENGKAARRVRKFKHLENRALDKLRYIISLKPSNDNESSIGGISQEYFDVDATGEANERLDAIFSEFDAIRTSSDSVSPILPIVARLYQQMNKICLVHALSRVEIGQTPMVDVPDVEFAYNTIMYYYENIQSIVDKYIHDGVNETTLNKVLNLIREKGTVTKSSLSQLTRFLKKRQRDEIIMDLIDMDYICVAQEEINGKTQTVYRALN